MEEAKVRAECPHCRVQATVLEKHLGREVRCRKCEQSFVLEAMPLFVAQEEPEAQDETYLRCPRCPAQEFGAEHGELGEHPCPECGGAYLPSSGVDRLADDYLDISSEQVRGLEGFVPKRPLPCPECGGDMSLLTLEGADLNFCSACGGLWFDDGELHRATGGRYGEPASRLPPRAPEPPSTPLPSNEPESTSEEPRGSREIDSKGKRSLLFGAAFAVVIFAFPLGRFVLQYLNTTIHELGHTLAFWVFGYPAVPSFDFVYGGGVSITFGRSRVILMLLFMAIAIFLWQQHRRPRAFWLAAALVGVYILVLATPLHSLFIVAMGHGMELIVAGIFLHRALVERDRWDDAERFLYAGTSFFVLLVNASLAWGLMTRESARSEYSMGKGGALVPDLIEIARTYLGTGLEQTAFLLLAGCLATPILTYLAYRNRLALGDRLRELWWPLEDHVIPR